LKYINLRKTTLSIKLTIVDFNVGVVRKYMPKFDGTGPMGAGPMTGRGIGRPCSNGGRPRLCRRIGFNPNITYFKPQGVPLQNLEAVELSAEELEALRLKNLEGMEQTDAAEKMNTSQSTFQRILASANKKVSEALVNGKAIKIIK